MKNEPNNPGDSGVLTAFTILTVIEFLGCLLLALFQFNWVWLVVAVVLLISNLIIGQIMEDIHAIRKYCESKMSESKDTHNDDYKEK